MNEYTITQLTDNNVEENNPQISENNVVWSANDGNDEEIFLYDGDTTTQITDNEVFDSEPQVSGSNLIWQRSDNDNVLGNSELIFYDGTETSIATIGSFSLPALSGNNVAWTESSLLGGVISLYDGNTTIQLPDSNASLNPNPDFISGDNIVWSGELLGENAGQILLYDGATTTQITDNDLTNIFPVVSGNNIAWTGADASAGIEDSEVFFYDGTTTIQLTDNDVFDVLSGISDSNIIWTSGDETAENRELFLYDGTDTISLSDNITAGSGSSISENNVVWAESDGNDLEIFHYDGNATSQVTDNDVDDRSPEIDGDSVVWSSSDDNDTEIFLATFNPTDSENSLTETTENNTSETVYRFLNSDTGVHFYTANEIERDAVEDLSNFSSEGASYQGVDPLTGIGEPSPVYRFLNRDTGVHLYTVSEVERDATEDLANFSFEGEAFFAYATEVDGSIPIYRFFNSTTGAHFYTPSAIERDAVLELPDYQSEGIAYYALPVSEDV